MNLSESLDRVDGFTKKLSSSVAVGEETGALDTMLVSIANQMEYDSEVAMNKLVSYLEPGDDRRDGSSRWICYYFCNSADLRLVCDDCEFVLIMPGSNVLDPGITVQNEIYYGRRTYI